MSDNLGFIKVWRCLQDWNWFDNTLYVGAFVKMILKANWKDKKWQGIVIKRGSFVSSTQNLAELFNITPCQAKNLLKHLKMTGEMSVKTTNKYSIYTIENYDKYQNLEIEMSGKMSGKMSVKQQTKTTVDVCQMSTTKELKEIKKKNKEPSSKNFDEDSDEFYLADLLLKHLLKLNPNFKQPNIQSWAKQVDLMHRVDKRSLYDIESNINFSAQDDFWQGVILSTSGLKRNFDKVTAARLKVESKLNKPVQSGQGGIWEPYNQNKEG